MKTAIRVMMMLAVVLLVASCGKKYDKEQAKAIIEKVNKGEELTSSDYDTCIDLMEAAMDESFNLMKEFKAAGEDKDKLAEVQKKAIDVQANLEGFDKIADIVEKAKDNNKLSDAQKKRLEDMQKKFEDAVKNLK